MQWDSYAPRVYAGHHYGMKSDSFGPYIDLPEKAGPRFELALGGNTAPRAVLRTKGWTLCNPTEPTREPWIYQHYIRQSKGEFSVAKHGYVVTRSGWFSERSACYLASGRPVVVQETGFSDCLQTGLGIVPFCTPEEALQQSKKSMLVTSFTVGQQERSRQNISVQTKSSVGLLRKP